MDLVSASEAARQLGVNPSQITRGIQSGLIPNRGVEGRPLVNVAEARQARAAGIDRSKQRGLHSPLLVVGQTTTGAPGAGASPSLQAASAPAVVSAVGPLPAMSASVPEAGLADDGDNPSYQASRARRETAAATKAEIELAQLRGQTLDRAEVADVAFRLGQMLREGMETRRAVLAQRLVGLEFGMMMAALAEADDAHLAALADAIARDLVSPAVDHAAA